MKFAGEQLGVMQPMRWSTLDGEHLLFSVGVIEYRISINEQHKCYPLQHCGKQKTWNKAVESE